jgi:hypothetical protein
VKAKANHGSRIADSQSSHLFSELDINDRVCYGFRNFSRQLFPNHILGLFIGPQSEEDRLPKLVVVRPLREHLGAKCQSAPFDDWPKSDDCHRNRQCAERGKSASYVRKILDHARTSGRWIALLIPFF